MWSRLVVLERDINLPFLPISFECAVVDVFIPLIAECVTTFDPASKLFYRVIRSARGLVGHSESHGECNRFRHGLIESPLTSFSRVILVRELVMCSSQGREAAELFAFQVVFCIRRLRLSPEQQLKRKRYGELICCLETAFDLARCIFYSS